MSVDELRAVSLPIQDPEANHIRLYIRRNERQPSRIYISRSPPLVLSPVPGLQIQWYNPASVHLHLELSGTHDILTSLPLHLHLGLAQSTAIHWTKIPSDPRTTCPFTPA